MIATAWIVSLYRLWIGRHKPEGRSNETVVMGTWSFIASVPLLGLYLYHPVMSSRYMMDFAPAFAVGLWVFLHLFAQLLRTRFTSAFPVIAACAALALWWAFQVTTAKIFTETGGGVAVRPPHGPAQTADLSRLDTNAYFPDTDFDAYRLPFNGYGWYTKDDRTASMIILFVRAANVVELDLRPAEGASPTERDWSRVRVRLGLEWLALQSSTPTARGRRLVFVRPSREHQKGVETAFIALAQRNLMFGPAKFRIDAVRWSRAEVGHGALTR
jgi:hypothetical protein